MLRRIALVVLVLLLVTVWACALVRSSDLPPPDRPFHLPDPEHPTCHEAGRPYCIPGYCLCVQGV